MKGNFQVRFLEGGSRSNALPLLDTVEYGSESDLLRRIRTIENELSAAAGKTRSTRTRLSFSRR